MTPPTLTNAQARRLFMQRHGLLAPPSGSGRGEGLAGQVRDLGFVQLDSVNTLARAHDLILWSRCGAYRPEALSRLHAQGALFESWTHDASLIPVEYYPHWQHRFARQKAQLKAKWEGWQGTAFHAQIDEVRAHAARGPISSGDLAPGAPRGAGGWWDWHPGKAALEYLWHTGELAIARRESFRKVYDLAERVIAPAHFSARPSLEESTDWAMMAGLRRLGFGTSGEIGGFFALVSPGEAKAWCAQALAAGRIEEIIVECQDGKPRKSFALPGLLEEAPALPPPGGARLRLLSPFDPMLRDRARAERLFGFHYRIEIFVPEPKRRWGYYVFPLLQGEKLVGRVDMKTDRAAGVIAVRALWPEAGVRWSKARHAAFEAEVERLCRFIGLGGVRYAEGWLREPQ